MAAVRLATVRLGLGYSSGDLTRRAGQGIVAQRGDNVQLSQAKFRSGC